MKKVSHSTFGSFKEIYAMRHEPEQFRALAHAYWGILIVIAAVVIMCSIAFGVWQFIVPLDSGDSNTSAPAPVVRGFKQEDLRALVDVLEKRKGDFETTSATSTR